MTVPDSRETSDDLDGLTTTLDRASFAAIARSSGGLSPATLSQSLSDWWLHLLSSPGQQIRLSAKAAHQMTLLGDYAMRSSAGGDAEPAIRPLPQDRRFIDPAWKQNPFDLIKQAFLLQQQWWHAATTGISGVTRHHESVVEFTMRQMLDTVAPSNFFATNPVLQRRILETGGQCLVQGARYFLDDLRRMALGDSEAGAEAYPAGEKLAVTPGKVVYRNRLIELIQYSPATGTVRPEPVLIVPAWIMKYYILDLSPDNSLIRWLVGEGYTVFCISWHNPDGEDRDLEMEDYRLLGPMAALDAVEAVTGNAKIHAAGYCLGGTLLAIAAAAMARDGDDRLASLTLFAAQTEFSEPGELGLFIDEAQLNLLDALMWSRGYLDTSQMGGAFQMLRSNDLIWSRMLRTYLMGDREPMSDLMAWNADGTRMPYAMHSQYLRRLFLNNDLAEGRYRVGEHAVSLSALRMPIFMVGTETDHVAPWRSVHKLHMLTGAEISFVLTSGGHNAGIVSEPGHPHRHYRIHVREQDGAAHSPEDWEARAGLREGSWWPEWGAWLGMRSGEPVAPPPMGTPEENYPPLDDAPGRYVRER